MPIIDKILDLPLPVLNHWGYWIILLSATLESSPIFGLLIPGQTIVILGGFFAKIGILDIGDVIWVASLGAILGDSIGYFLGKRYGYSFILKYGKYFLFKKEYYKKIKRLVNRHTGKTLFIGRFNPLTRAFAPFVAGTSDVGILKFFTYNIIGGISWAVFFTLIGFIFGKSYEIASKYIERVILIAIAFSVLIIYVYYRIKK